MSKQFSEMKQLVATIDSISSATDGGQVQATIDCVDRFFAMPYSADDARAWFRLFERFPDEDGYESYWTILHNLERMPCSDELVVESIRRRPSTFPVLMVNRLLNAGVTRVGSDDLLQLLREVAEDERAHPSVRQDAKRYIEHQTTHS